MEYSPTELVKLNSVNSSKHAGFEGKVPLVPFVDFLQLQNAEPEHKESSPKDLKVDRPEPLKETERRERKEPVARLKPDNKHDKTAAGEETGVPAEDPENLSALPEKPAKSSDAVEKEETPAQTAETTPSAKKEEGMADADLATGQSAEILGLVQNVVTPGTPGPLNTPLVTPVAALDEAIEKAAPVKAAPTTAGVNATKGGLPMEGVITLAGEAPMLVAPRPLSDIEIPVTADKSGALTKAAGPLIFNGEAKDGFSQTSSGTSGNGQPMLANGAKPLPQAPIPNATPILPSGGMDIGISSFAATTPTPISEAPLGGLSPLNVTETAASRPAGVMPPMQGRAPAATPPLVDQVAVHMKQATEDGLDRIRIQLKPSSLGNIDVKMEIAKDGKVMAVISIERPETFELLQRDARSLERALLESGLQADSNSLNFQLRGQESGQTAEHLSGNGALADNVDELTVEEATSPEDYNVWIVGDGIVDIHV